MVSSLDENKQDQNLLCYSVLDDTRCALKNLSCNDKLQQVANWVEKSTWYGDTCGRVHQAPARWPEAMVCPCLLNFRSPVVKGQLAGAQVYLTIDTGCSRTLVTSKYAQEIFGKNYKQYLSPFSSSFKDAQGNSMKIEGQITGAALILGRATLYPTIIIYTAKHNEALLGWDLVVQQKWAVDQDGIWNKNQMPHRNPLPAPPGGGSPPQVYHHPPQTTPHTSEIYSNDKCQEACSSGPQGGNPSQGDDTWVHPQDAHHPTHSTKDPCLHPPIQVIACHQYQILPRMADFIQVAINPETWKKEKEHLSSQLLVFSSETIEDHLPLSDLSIYFQVIQMNHEGQAKILYRNNSKQTVFISPKDIVGHAELMLSAGVAEMEACADSDPVSFVAYRVLTPGNLVAPGEDPELGSIIQPDLSRFEFGIESHHPDPNTPVNCASTNQKDIKFINNLVNKHHQLFSSHSWSIGKLGSEFSLHVKSGVIPQQQKLIPIPIKLREQAFQIIQTLLDNGLIVESQSPWLSNCLFLLKKPAEKPTAAGQQLAGDHQTNINEQKSIPISSVRFVLDFRCINSSLARTWTSFVIPEIKDILNNIQGHKYVSSCDVSQSFWTIPLKQGLSQELTSFCAFGTQFQCTRLAQGLAPASAVFSRALHKVLLKNGFTADRKKLKFPPPQPQSHHQGDLPDGPPTSPGPPAPPAPADSSAVVNYVDNIIIASPTREAHHDTLTRLFAALQNSGIKLKLGKSHFFITKSINLFGYEVSVENGTICPEKKKLQAIDKLEPPKTRRNLKKILGIFNYFCDLLPASSVYLSPLYHLTSDKIPFKFTEVHLKAFLHAKRQLQKVPLCYLMDLSKPAFFFTDCAMGNSTSYVVLQYHQKLDRLVPCRFQSHVMNSYQKSYSQAKGEALGLTILIAEQLSLLVYSHNWLFTDAKSLTFISRFKYSNSQVFRWSQLLHSIDLSLIWLPANNFFLQLTDIFTRPQQSLLKHQIKKKVSMSQTADLCFLDFFGLPSMSLAECTKILDKFHSLLDQLSPAEVRKRLQNRENKHQLAPVPHLNVPVTLSAGDRAFLCITTDCQLNSLQNKPLSIYCRAVNPRPTWLSDIKNRFHNYFPHMSLKNLISFQEKDSYIQNQLKLRKNSYIYIGGVVCKYIPINNQNNHQEICQIVWPQVLNSPLLEKAHIINSAYHLGHDKTKTSLQSMFKIRNFSKDFMSMSNQCKFCMLNKKHKVKPIPAGLTFTVHRPRAFVQFDICTLNSNWTKGSFLLIVDVVSLYITVCQCSNSPTAQEVYSLLLTNWISYFGVFLGSTKDNGSNMSCQLEGEIHALLNARSFHITPYQSCANGLAEKCNFFITHIVKCLFQSHVVTEQNLQLCLSFASLAWNATPLTSTGVSPAYLQLGGDIRTHNFLSFASLKNAENKGSLVKELAIVRETLFQLLERKKQANLLKNDKLQEHTENIHAGDFCLILKKSLNTRVGHKLRPKYFTDVFRIIQVKNTYILAFKWEKSFPLKSRFHGLGDISKRQYYRFQKSRVKKLENPEKYLGLNLNNQLLIKAASVLGEAVPANRITFLPPPSPPVTHLEKAIENGGLWQHFLPGGLYELQAPSLQARLAINRKLLSDAKLWIKHYKKWPKIFKGPHSDHSDHSDHGNQVRPEEEEDKLSGFSGTHLVTLDSGVSFTASQQLLPPPVLHPVTGHHNRKSTGGTPVTCSYGDTSAARQFHQQARRHRDTYLRDVESQTTNIRPQLLRALKKKKFNKLSVPDVINSLCYFFCPKETTSTSFESSTTPAASSSFQTPIATSSIRETSTHSPNHEEGPGDGGITSSASPQTVGSKDETDTTNGTFNSIETVASIENPLSSPICIKEVFNKEKDADSEESSQEDNEITIKEHPIIQIKIPTLTETVTIQDMGSSHTVVPHIEASSELSDLGAVSEDSAGVPRGPGGGPGSKGSQVSKLVKRSTISCKTRPYPGRVPYSLRTLSPGSPTQNTSPTARVSRYGRRKPSIAK